MSQIVTDECVVCETVDHYSRRNGRIYCAFHQLRHYQLIEREQGQDAVVTEAIRMSRFDDQRCPVDAV